MLIMHEDTFNNKKFKRAEKLNAKKPKKKRTYYGKRNWRDWD